MFWTFSAAYVWYEQMLTLFHPESI
jgi:hypothetical protein